MFYQLAAYLAGESASRKLPFEQLLVMWNIAGREFPHVNRQVERILSSLP